MDLVWRTGGKLHDTDMDINMNMNKFIVLIEVEVDDRMYEMKVYSENSTTTVICMDTLRNISRTHESPSPIPQEAKWSEIR